jgi:hypothetical protein
VQPALIIFVHNGVPQALVGLLSLRLSTNAGKLPAKIPEQREKQ